MIFSYHFLPISMLEEPYIPCIWGLFATGFLLFMAFKKEKMLASG